MPDQYFPASQMQAEAEVDDAQAVQRLVVPSKYCDVVQAVQEVMAFVVASTVGA